MFGIRINRSFTRKSKGKGRELVGNSNRVLGRSWDGRSGDERNGSKNVEVCNQIFIHGLPPTDASKSTKLNRFSVATYLDVLHFEMTRGQHHSSTRVDSIVGFLHILDEQSLVPNNVFV